MTTPIRFSVTPAGRPTAEGRELAQRTVLRMLDDALDALPPQLPGDTSVVTLVLMEDAEGQLSPYLVAWDDDAKTLTLTVTVSRNKLWLAVA